MKSTGEGLYKTASEMWNIIHLKSEASTSKET